MNYFQYYSSNTVAGSGNQLYFTIDEEEIRTGRVFYRVTAGGKYDYSFLFSNLMDSTFSDGKLSHKNLICEPWTIHEANIKKVKKFNTEKEITDLEIKEEGGDVIFSTTHPITFSGNCKKVVMPGEFFYADPVSLSFEKNEYFCLEITFSGTMLPYHEESLLPIFVKQANGWNYCRQMPVPGMIGCSRKVKLKIGYLGDSITQGIGTPYNSYLHWNAILSEMLGEEYAYWNLGLGYGRANDAASDGAWLYKAKQNDVVVVCYGVNDLLRGRTEEQIKQDLKTIVSILKEQGIKVVLQTIPPFDYEGELTKKWTKMNEYIKTVLCNEVDLIFDNVTFLGDKEHPQKALFGGHPNAEGCKIWAEEFYHVLKPFLEEVE